MVSVTEEQIKLHETFNIFDTKGDGKIFYSQFGDVLRAMGQNPTELDVKKHAPLENHDERLSFDVFLPILLNFMKNSQPPSIQDFIEGLRVFDKDNNGSMSSAELRHLLTTIGERLSEEEVEQLISGQEDPNGNVVYEDFIKMVMNG
ncbi:myosin-2 essential light chain-like isoform X2 [Gordionus sp. m RMFG-2023]|uniref:myosin-2 essential light chain-like isoform X2 n=1 Tax=Gordionus sp. m RMFG-2023 TaxID=3053472 RepID=UPI0031FD393D